MIVSTLDWIKIQIAIFYYRWFGPEETEDEFKVLEVEDTDDIIFDYDRFSK